MQEALLAASQQWAEKGVPDNPRAWLMTVASRRLVDEWRREGARRRREETAAMLECTDSQFLPAAMVEKMAAQGGRGKLQARLMALKQIVNEL